MVSRLHTGRFVLSRVGRGIPVHILGDPMRKSALILALAVVVAAPSVALAQKAAPANPNANGQKFVRAAFMQPYLAWQSVWAPKAAPAKATAPAKKAKKSKKKR